MICAKCGNGVDRVSLPGKEGDDYFETLEFEESTSNWDDWDLCAKYKCKKCGNIKEIEQ